jgi:hypothetical protein
VPAFYGAKLNKFIDGIVLQKSFVPRKNLLGLRSREGLALFGTFWTIIRCANPSDKPHAQSGILLTLIGIPMRKTSTKPGVGVQAVTVNCAVSGENHSILTVILPSLGVRFCRLAVLPLRLPTNVWHGRRCQTVKRQQLPSFA